MQQYRLSYDRLEDRFGPAVTIVGIVTEAELEQLYANATLFVMPSFYEGFGMPFIEAMRYGVPVIGTRVGGIPEVVPPETGILIEPGQPGALADAIESLLDDPGLAAALSSAGAAWSRQFWWPNVIDILESDYRKACKNEDPSALSFHGQSERRGLASLSSSK